MWYSELKILKHIHSRKVDNRMFLLAGTTAHGTYLWRCCSM